MNNHTSISEVIIRKLREQRDKEIEKNTQLEAELDDWREANRKVMAEECPSDEKHCTCVPYLKTEVERLREACQLALDKLMDDKPYIALGIVEDALEGGDDVA